VVESYQSLQEDHSQTSVDLLRHISHQLANSSFPAAPDSSQFHAQRSDVRVNICWFVSLLLSLVVALFGIFLKQWMRTYMKWTDVTPDRDAVLLRHFRYCSLESWGVGAILTLLPTLLQLSVVLFLSGLLVFLRNLNQVLAGVMEVLTGIVFFLVATVIATPVISRSCPYRTPLSEILMLSLWRVIGYAKFAGSAIWVFIQSGQAYSVYSWRWDALAYRWRTWSKTPLPTSWVQADKDTIAQHSDEDHVSMCVGAMAHLCCTTQSQPLWVAAISAITAEYPRFNHLLTLRIRDVYCNEIWWLVLGHIMQIHEEDMLSQSCNGYGLFKLYIRIASEFTRFSSSMKRCWLDFLLQSKTLICESYSNSVISLYLLCCTQAATEESATAGHLMSALVEVLAVQHLKVEENVLDAISSELCMRSAAMLGSPILCQGVINSGLTFPDTFVPQSEPSPQEST
jgi:hypothetical protein